MNIYQPYFYIIQDIRNGMYYAGSKWAKGCHPDYLLKEGGYPTSSTTINDIIDKNGLDTFVIRRIRTFETGDEAYDYETKFLIKVDARHNKKFYNGHNNTFPSARDYRKLMTFKYGVDHNMKVPEIQKRRLEKIDEKWGSYSNMMIDTGAIEKTHNTCEKRYGNKYAVLLPHAVKAKEDKNLLKYGYKNAFQSMDLQRQMKEKGQITFAKNYESKQKPIIENLLESDIDFSKYGWVSKAAEIIGIKPQKVSGWMKRNIPDFYKNYCYKRTPYK